MWAEFEKGWALAWNQFGVGHDLHGQFEKVFGWGVINVILSVVECVAIVEFFPLAQAWNLVERPSSRVAQWERAGPITQRSEDQNLALLSLLNSFIRSDEGLTLETSAF